MSFKQFKITKQWPEYSLAVANIEKSSPRNLMKNESEACMFRIAILTERWDWKTVAKSITSEACCTNAHRWMIYNSTLRIGCTGPWAWVDTFLTDASLIRWTVRADYTFRATVWCWPDHSSNTTALGLSRNHLALWVGSTWWWRAWVRWYGS